jgi:hypothetical protein
MKRVKFQHGIKTWIMPTDGTWRRECKMLDASDEGARLLIGENLGKLKAKEFFLLLSSTGLAYRRCALIWVNGGEVGVEFMGAENRTAIAPPAFQPAEKKPPAAPPVSLMAGQCTDEFWLD